MIDLNVRLNELRRDGTIARIARNPARQFGLGNRRYIGAEILPERIVPQNVFKDEGIRYRRLIAVDADRYSPVEIRNGAVVGSVIVELMDNSTGSQMTAQEIDTLQAILEAEDDARTIATVTEWEDETLVLPLAEKNELYRWQAITTAVVQRRGSNGMREDVAFPNPPGVRTAAGGLWSSNAYDPFPDIQAHQQRLASLGLPVGRIVTSTRVRNILLNNQQMRLRLGAGVMVNGTFTPTGTAATPALLNQYLAQFEMPPIEVYDLRYETNSGNFPFLPTDVFCMFAATGQRENVRLLDGNVEMLEDTIGYVGIGRVGGQPAPGRHVLVWYTEVHPVTLKGEAVQTSGPVLNRPDAFGVISSIN